MNYGLKDKVALVGGSSRGIGFGCALQLAKEGAQIVLCSRGKKDLEEAKKSIEQKCNVTALAVTVDLRESNEIEKLVKTVIEHFGRIDILINNSGGPKPGCFPELDDTDWLDAYNLILAYNVRMCRLVIPYMRKKKWGRIINITSAVVKEPADNLILSNVFRIGIVALARTLARELINDNITVNNICPAAFKTSRSIQLMETESERHGKTVEEIEKNILTNLPLGRFHEPEELGDLVAFLASTNARGLTGTTISIDGGKQKSLF